MFSLCFKRRVVDDDEYQPHSHNVSTSQTIVIYHEPNSTQTQLSKKQLKVNQKQLEKWQKQFLDAHNKYRVQHGVKPLKLNKKLNTFAAEWANHLANNNLVKYRENIKYGENIAHCFGLSFQPESCVKKWYDEIINYKFDRSEVPSNTSHFTQVVWRNTKQLGVGVAVRGNSIWIVCNYNPSGNVVDQYLDCVPRPLEETNLNTVTQKSQPLPNSSKSTRRSRDTKNWSDFELDCLESHNKFRAMHGCPELKLNRTMCVYAIEWSKILAKRRTLQHRQNNKYGENLFHCQNYDPTADHCIKSFYDEIQLYNFSKPGFSSETGHFTAVVWKDTRELGVGITKIGNETFVVCNYSPPGNVRNYYKDQVPPPLRGSKPTTSKKVAKQNENSPPFEQVCLDGHSNIRVTNDSTPIIVNKTFKTDGNWSQVRTTQISYTIRQTNI